MADKPIAIVSPRFVSDFETSLRSELFTTKEFKDQCFFQPKGFVLTNVEY